MKKNNQAKYEEMQRYNTELNNLEYEQRKIHLDSYPQAIFIQVDAPCNHNCLFCSRPEIYRYFDLDEFRKDFEDLLMPVFLRVNRINLTGSGELSRHRIPEIQLPATKAREQHTSLFGGGAG